jgi:hypothetical protein
MHVFIYVCTLSPGGPDYKTSDAVMCSKTSMYACMHLCMYIEPLGGQHFKKSDAVLLKNKYVCVYVGM